MRNIQLKLLLVKAVLIIGFPRSNYNRYLQQSSRYQKVVNRLIACRGVQNTFVMVKAIRTHILNIQAGTPLQHSLCPSVGINKEGMPRLVSFLSELLTGDPWDTRLLMTQQYLTRVLPGHGKASYESITQGPTLPNQSLLKDLRIVVPSIIRFKPGITWTEPHLTTKVGPLGPALDQALNELRFLPSWLVKDQITQGGSEFTQYLRKCQVQVRNLMAPQSVRTPRGSHLRRLSHVLDPEGKVRVIAIFDYWSQTVLKPIHNAFLHMQKGIEADCTFNQTGRLDSISPNPRFYCYDLTTATDRFPLWFQTDQFKIIYGTEKAEAWMRVLVKMDFMTPEGDRLFYQAGQPMGAYSSWPVFSLCHHLVVQIAAQRAGLNLPYANYMLLGDDIVLGDEMVANNYRLIMHDLGVPIDLNKSQVSSDTLEFAKRQVHNKVDVSPAPVRSLTGNVQNNLSGVLAFLQEIGSRWELTTLVTRPVITDLMTTILPGRDVSLPVKRLWESWILPTNRDDPDFRSEKARQCFSFLCQNYLGCSVSEERIWLVLNQLIPMLQISKIQSVIKGNFIAYRKYLLQIISIYNKGTNDGIAVTDNMLAYLVQTIPAQRVSADQANNLQAELDRIEDLIENGSEELILETRPIMGFDPGSITRLPRSRDITPVSSIPKGQKGLVKMYLKSIQSELTD